MLAALLASCQTVETSVESYSHFPGHPGGKTIHVYPSKAASRTTAWKSARPKIEAAFREKGFKIASSAKAAAYEAQIHLQIDGGRLVDTVDYLPNYGVTSIEVSSGYGYGDTVTVTPAYGVTGHTAIPGKMVVYRRGLAVRIYDGRDKILFQATADSSGGCNNLALVAPYLTRAVLKNFPKETNGNVSMSFSENC
ncbi:hypothetical protein OA90_17100 [Labrenzia sp. OB1]|nr:hypothetical protein OA90_17100 [Labrenzia sp. OB1]